MPSIVDDIFNYPIDGESLRVLQANIVVRQVSKGDILMRKGDEVTKIFFVKSGCLRSYSVDKKGKEHIFMFAPEGWVISDMAASVEGSPAELFIDAIEDSEVEVCDAALFNNSVTPTQLSMTRLLRRASVLQKRIIMLMSAPLQDRYVDFVETYPNIAQRVPQKMIASYLGVTPEALSKIRGDLSKGK